MDSLCNEHEAEVFKAGIHLTLFGLAVTCLCYNLMAWGQRREAHLGRNILVYATLTAYEAHQISRHIQDTLEGGGDIMANWPKSRLKANGRVMLLAGYGVKLNTYRARQARRLHLAHRLMRKVLTELRTKP